MLVYTMLVYTIYIDIWNTHTHIYIHIIHALCPQSKKIEEKAKQLNAFEEALEKERAHLQVCDCVEGGFHKFSHVCCSCEHVYTECVLCVKSRLQKGCMHYHDALPCTPMYMTIHTTHYTQTLRKKLTEDITRWRRAKAATAANAQAAAAQGAPAQQPVEPEAAGAVATAAVPVAPADPVAQQLPPGGL